MLKTLKTAIAIAILAALAVVLNPSAEKHRAKISQTVAERSQLQKALGVGKLTAFVSQYHSVQVGSYTTVNGKLASVGAYGWVFVLE